MDGTLQDALQGGKANPKMKTVWMLRWSFRYILFLIFFMFFFVFRIFVSLYFADLAGNLWVLLLIIIILPIILGFLISYLWAHLYWSKYKFEIGSERVTITRGVIGKRIVNIPYERVQNVNIFRLRKIIDEKLRKRTPPGVQFLVNCVVREIEDD